MSDCDIIVGAIQDWQSRGLEQEVNDIAGWLT